MTKPQPNPQPNPRALIFLGPPGSGKGTQAARIRDNNNFLHLATGDLLREEARRQSTLGKEVDKIMNTGALVPDELMLRIVGSVLGREEAKGKNVIFDGFPRTRQQAEGLSQLLARRGFDAVQVFVFVMDEEALVSRLAGRFICGTCGAVYHDEHRLPKQKEKCDVCGGSSFVRRQDDAESAIRARLEVYHRQTKAVIPFYEEQSIVHRLDVEGPEEQVAAKIDAML